MTTSIEITDRSVEICLRKIKFGNSFGLNEARALEQALSQAVKLNLPLVFSAEGRFFCAGGDVKEYAKFDQPEPGIRINRGIRKILDDVFEAEIPSLVIIQGDCFGGGIELVSAFDHIIATEQALLGFWQRRIGLSFGWGGGHRLSRRMSEKNVKALALNAQTMSARRACEIGLVDRIFHPRDISEHRERWISLQSRLSKASLKALSTKGLAGEQENFEAIWMNPDHKKALKRFR